MSRPDAPPDPLAGKPAERPVTRDPERTRRLILEAARAAFARYGLDGARVDAIAAASGANKRMIYYYFTDKEGLFLATLETVYAELSGVTDTLDPAGPPEAALAQYVDAVWSYYLAHPEAIAILNNENLHGGRHLRRSTRLGDLERPYVEKLDRILRRGAESGTFRPGLDAVFIHITVIALAYLFIGNTPTLSIYFGRDLATPEARQEWRAHMEDAVGAIVARRGR